MFVMFTYAFASFSVTFFVSFNLLTLQRKESC